eukprot:3153313-Amphidinium_carterae.1
MDEQRDLVHEHLGRARCLCDPGVCAIADCCDDDGRQAGPSDTDNWVYVSRGVGGKVVPSPVAREVCLHNFSTVLCEPDLEQCESEQDLVECGLSIDESSLSDRATSVMDGDEAFAC